MKSNSTTLGYCLSFRAFLAAAVLMPVRLDAQPSLQEQVEQIDEGREARPQAEPEAGARPRSAPRTAPTAPFQVHDMSSPFEWATSGRPQAPRSGPESSALRKPRARTAPVAAHSVVPTAPLVLPAPPRPTNVGSRPIAAPPGLMHQLGRVQQTIYGAPIDAAERAYLQGSGSAGSTQATTRTVTTASRTVAAPGPWIPGSVGVRGEVVGTGGEKFSLVEVYKIAIDRDPSIKGSLFRNLSAQQIERQALAAFLPDVDYLYEKTQVRQNILETGNPLFRTGTSGYPTKYWAATVTQSLFNVPAFVRWKRSVDQGTLADAEYKVAQQELVLRVARLYLEAMAARDSIELTRSELAAVEQQFVLAQEKVSAELAPASDLLEAQARLSAVRADLIESQNRARDSYRALTEVTRLKITNLARLKPGSPLEFPEPTDLDFWENLAMEQSLELVAQKERVNVAQEDIRVQQAEYFPNLSAVGRQSNRDTEGTIFGGGSEIENTEFLIRADWNPFQGGRTSAAAKEARYLYYSEKTDLEKLELSLRRRVATAFEGVVTSIHRVQALLESMAFQEQVLRSRQEGFSVGLYTALAVLDAEQELHRVRREFTQARYDYLLNGLVLNQAVGSLDESDIVRLNERLE